MRPLDWAVLFAALAGIVLYGLWKGRAARSNLACRLAAARHGPIC